MRRLPLGAARVGASLACLAACTAAGSDQAAAIGRAQLCVTEGAVSDGPGGALSVVSPAMRAVVPQSGGDEVEARFAFLGPTDQTAVLGSGETRQQFGLKLRAADPCNLVYAMWRFTPTPGVVVQVKSNPGAHDSQTCRNNGYRDVAPSLTRPVDAPAVGHTYRLQARIEASRLTVSIDGSAVWQGYLDAAALADAGPAGIRSDNAKLTLRLFAPTAAPSATPPPACRTGGDD